MSSSRRFSLSRNLALSWAVHAVTLATGFYLMPQILHTLGDRSYGVWVLLNSISSYAGLMYLGFGETVLRFTATHSAMRDWRRLNEVVSVTFAVYSVMSVVAVGAGIALAVSAPWWNTWDGDELGRIRLVILLLSANVACGMLGSTFGGVLMGLQRFEFERTLSVVVDILRLVLIIGLLTRDNGLEVLAGIYLGLTALENAAYAACAFWVLPDLRLSPRLVTWTAVRSCAGFSLFAFLSSVAYQLIYATDAVVIGFVLGPQAIVPYSIALRLCEYLRRPLQQINALMLPRAGQLAALADGRAVVALVERGAGAALLLTGSLWIGMAAFGGLLIETWVGSGYEESHTLLMLLFGAQVFAVPLGVIRAVLSGLGKVRFPALLYLGEAVANLVLSLALVHGLGRIGVAWGTLLPVMLLELGLLLPYAARQLKVRPWDLAAGIVGPQLLPLGGVAVYSAILAAGVPVESNWLWLMAVAIGGGAVLGGGWWLQRRGPAGVSWGAPQ